MAQWCAKNAVSSSPTVQTGTRDADCCGHISDSYRHDYSTLVTLDSAPHTVQM